jgi:mevalonate kinase
MSATAHGKIILTGEYAVLFGYPGIAVPTPHSVTAHFQADPMIGDIVLNWEADEDWVKYVEDIINLCVSIGSVPPGTITIENTIPLNKGMGSSTAFVIAITKCLFGEDCEEQAVMVEDTLNPGHSGIDFAAIWNSEPIKFIKDEVPEFIDLPSDILNGALLIDTGKPDQQTPELVKWIRSRKQELEEPLKIIGECSKKLQESGDLSAVMREHNTAQQSLGIVSDKVKDLITKIEQEGGSAKVVGAGGRTGGSGMVLAFNINESCIPNEYPVIPLNT